MDPPLAGGEVAEIHHAVFVAEKDRFADGEFRRFIWIDDKFEVPVGEDGAEAGKLLRGGGRRLVQRARFAVRLLPFSGDGQFREAGGELFAAVGLFSGSGNAPEERRRSGRPRFGEGIMLRLAAVVETGVFRAGDPVLPAELLDRSAGAPEEVAPVGGGGVLPPLRQEETGQGGRIALGGIVGRRNHEPRPLRERFEQRRAVGVEEEEILPRPECVEQSGQLFAGDSPPGGRQRDPLAPGGDVADAEEVELIVRGQFRRASGEVFAHPRRRGPAGEARLRLLREPGNVLRRKSLRPEQIGQFPAEGAVFRRQLGGAGAQLQNAGVPPGVQRGERQQQEQESETFHLTSPQLPRRPGKVCAAPPACGRARSAPVPACGAPQERSDRYTPGALRAFLRRRSRCRNRRGRGRGAFPAERSESRGSHNRC